MILLKQMQKGTIDVNSFQFSIKSDLNLDQLAVLLFEIRYKGELKQAGIKIQDLVSSKGLDFQTEVWNDYCQV